LTRKRLCSKYFILKEFCEKTEQEKNGRLAQPVEQLTLNQRVTGSIPVSPSKNKPQSTSGTQGKIIFNPIFLDWQQKKYIISFVFIRLLACKRSEEVTKDK
jgi:hypothetical protein